MLLLENGYLKLNWIIQSGPFFTPIERSKHSRTPPSRSQCNSFLVISFGSVSPLRSLTHAVYYVPACCIYAIWFFLVLCCVQYTMVPPEMGGECTSREHGTKPLVSSLNLHNAKVTGQFYGNNTKHCTTGVPCVIPPLLFQPSSHPYPRLFRKSLQSGATRAGSSFRLTSAIDKAFCPGVIVWLLPALCKTMKSSFWRWEIYRRTSFHKPRCVFTHRSLPCCDNWIDLLFCACQGLFDSIDLGKRLKHHSRLCNCLHHHVFFYACLERCRDKVPRACAHGSVLTRTIMFW